MQFYFRMTKTLSMISHNNYKLSANEGFVTFWTSKLLHVLLTVTLCKWNPSQIPFFNLLIYSMKLKIHIGFWTLKVKCTYYGFCRYLLWSSRMQGQWVFRVGKKFQLGPKKFDFLDDPESTSSEKFMGGVFFVLLKLSYVAWRSIPNIVQFDSQDKHKPILSWCSSLQWTGNAAS